MLYIREVKLSFSIEKNLYYFLGNSNCFPPFHSLLSGSPIRSIISIHCAVLCYQKLHLLSFRSGSCMKIYLSGFCWICLLGSSYFNGSFFPCHSIPTKINGMSFVISLTHKSFPWGLMDCLIFAAVLQSSLSSTPFPLTCPVHLFQQHPLIFS